MGSADPGYTVVIGAGACGLAAAMELAAETEVLVLESADGIGRGASSRNSEVLHAGLYYTPGSLKARLCIEGARVIHQLGAEGRIGIDVCGKAVIALGEEELPALKALQRNAEENGVTDLRLLDVSALRERLPRIRAAAGLFSPRTAVLDSHSLLEHFRRSALSRGAELLFHHRVTGVERRGDSWLLRGQGPEGAFELPAAAVVNAAGLYSDRLAEAAGLDLDRHDLRLRWNRGEYFAAARWTAADFAHLVYPMPSADGHLGIHLTRDTGGGIRFGPSLEKWPGEEDYRQDLRLRPAFCRDLARWLPDLREEDLQPAGTGLRARLMRFGAGRPRDFHIAEESEAGLPRWINLIGIESPGLTASPAIGRRVRELWKTTA